MERTYLQWNFPNWITVFLMVMIGCAVVSAATAAIKGKTGAA
jgi:hypothetical protein